MSQLVKYLSKDFELTLIDPNGTFQNIDEIPNKSQKSFARDILSAAVNFIRSFFMRKQHNQILILEDLYITLLLFPLLLVRRVTYIYHASDYGDKYRHSFLKYFSGLALPLLPLLKFGEKLIIKFSSLIIVPSEEMKEEMIKHLIDAKKIAVLPYLPTKRIVTHQEKRVMNEDSIIKVLFLGNMTYPPNTDSFNFIKSIASIILKEHKDINLVFLIVGRIPLTLKHFETENLKILGEIKNLDEIFEQCSIGINPSITPGGTSIKVIDYLINGLLVLSTPQGCNGVIKNENLIVRERSEFVEEILNLTKKIRLHQPSVELPQVLQDYYLSTDWYKNLKEKIDEI
ncbi:MAG: glycosyltransferase [Thermoplasmatales archaeon]